MGQIIKLEKERENEGLRKILLNHEKTIGTIASVLAIVMFVSLFEIFYSNLLGNSDIYFQPLATALNGSVWCLYAYAKGDWYLFIPNGLAVVLGIMTAIAAFV